MRERFQEKLKLVKLKVLRMGALTEKIIEDSVEALKNQDLELAGRIDVDDDRIDEIGLEIEKDCLSLLALQQPLAKDLRTIATIFKITTDLERMGDHAVNISKLTLKIGKAPLIKPLIDIPIMAELCKEMVKYSLDAFVKEDVVLAADVYKKDDKVDDIYESILEEVINLITEDKSNTDQGTKLIFIARYLERIADHTTNICERVIYMVTGELKEIH